MSFPTPAASPVPAAPTPGPSGDANNPWLSADRVFMVLLAVSFPAAVASHFLFPGTWTFILCAVALIPLARLMGESTEVIAHMIALDGESNWLEGVMLLGVYAILGVTFFFIP